MSSQWFPTEITDEEKAFGFAVIEVRLGNRTVAAAELGPGLRAVKVRGRGGCAQYLVCNEKLAPLHRAASSLDDLRTRFPRQ